MSKDTLEACNHGYAVDPEVLQTALLLTGGGEHVSESGVKLYDPAQGLVRMEELLRISPYDSKDSRVSNLILKLAVDAAARGDIEKARDVYRRIPILQACKEYGVHRTFKALHLGLEDDSSNICAYIYDTQRPCETDRGLLQELFKHTKSCTCLSATLDAVTAPRAPGANCELVNSYKNLPKRTVHIHVELRAVTLDSVTNEESEVYSTREVVNLPRWLGVAVSMKSKRYVPWVVEEGPPNIVMRKVFAEYMSMMLGGNLSGSSGAKFAPRRVTVVDPFFQRYFGSILHDLGCVVETVVLPTEGGDLIDACFERSAKTLFVALGGAVHSGITFTQPLHVCSACNSMKPPAKRETEQQEDADNFTSAICESCALQEALADSDPT